MPVVAPDGLARWLARVFEAAGAPPPDAAAVADHLVTANLMGHDSHGAVRTVQYVDAIRAGRIRPGAAIAVERETAVTAVVDGNWNFGQIVAREAMALAIGKARGHGLAAVAGYRSAHIGRAGAYGEQAAAAGLAALGFVNGHGGGVWAAPFGGLARRLATNPLFVAAPTGDPDAPFVLDMATPVAAEGKVRVARNRGAELPPGWIVDAAGAPSTDPHDLYGGDPPDSRPRGALLPLGGSAGHKGSGLSLAVDLLAGALGPAGTSAAGGPGGGRPAASGGGNGFFMIAIDPVRFGDRGRFEDTLADLLAHVRRPPVAEGFDAILTPGEPERRRMAERRAGLPIDGETWRQLGEAAAAAGAPPWDGGADGGA